MVVAVAVIPKMAAISTRNVEKGKKNPYHSNPSLSFSTKSRVRAFQNFFFTAGSFSVHSVFAK